MNRKQKGLLGFCAGFIGAVSAGLLLPALSPASNCGGNASAMAACHSIEIVLRLAGDDSATTAPAAILGSREEVRQIAGLYRLGDAKVWVNSAVNLNGPDDVLIAVCDTPFDNVPRRVLLKTAMSHAALFRDRGVVLISETEFESIDLTGFVDVATIASDWGDH